MGCDHCALGYVHALLIKREQFKLASIGALDMITDDDGVFRSEGE
jgi:hypothetical protein